MKTQSQPHELAGTEQDLRTQMERHPFLAGMSSHHLDMLSQYAQQRRFQRGEMVFRAGEEAHGFYLIQHGTVALEGSVIEGEPIASDVVNSGEALGWSWLFPPYRWHFDARAIEPTTAIFLAGDTLRQHYNEDLTLAHALFKRMSTVMVHRLQHTRRKLIETMQIARDLSPVSRS